LHTTALISGKQFFDVYCSYITDAVVVDIGSQNVNGSLKDVCPSPLTYIGVDFVAGEGVDVILDDPYELPFSDESVDIVVCSSCFEHSEMFWLLFLEVLRILKPKGLFYLNIPSNGAFHQYPVDCWRFYPDSGRALVTWAKRNGLAPALLESFTTKQNQDIWNDFVAIFLKDARHIHRYPKRLIRSRRDYYNGYVNGKSAIRCPQIFSEDEILFEKSRKAVESLTLECERIRSE
jgi:SAM-dependent methyltransferase